MKQYLNLLEDIRKNGVSQQQRAVLQSTGTRPRTLSVFGRQLRFDLREGFPLVTTKKMPWLPIVHELIWFLKGSTNIKYLQQNGVKIWDQWASPNGELGPVYGKQWRAWRGPQGTIDQIQKLIDDIKKVRDNPEASEARRLLLFSWNPADLPDPKVPTGCHTFSQFYIHKGMLSCQMYQRSADMFLGVPFNIASYALLTHILAHITELQPWEYVHTFGDAHIYDNHQEQIEEQIGRSPIALPRLKINGNLNINHLRAEQFELLDYKSWPILKGEVAV